MLVVNLVVLRNSYPAVNYIYVDYAALAPYAIAMAQAVEQLVDALTLRVQTLEAHFPP